MELVALLVTLICYGLAAYLLWSEQTPIYLITLVSGHIGALASPLWALLYEVIYRSDMAVLGTIFGQPLLRDVLVASAWFYTLPALMVIYLFVSRWWFPGYMTGLLTFAIFMLYHLLIETLGLRTAAWYYAGEPQMLPLPTSVVSAIMGGLTSLALLYTLLLVLRSSWQSMLMALLPATLALSLLVHGLLGAPLWLALLLSDQSWAINIGFFSSLGLLGWAAHIINAGFSQAARHATV